MGPLTDLPDYSFLDGRTTPIGGHQKKRLMKQREYAEKIVTLTAEIDFAVQRHKDIQADKIALRNRILANRLKEKGQKLLNKAQENEVNT